jgi:hypothetical protein
MPITTMTRPAWEELPADIRNRIMDAFDREGGNSVGHSTNCSGCRATAARQYSDGQWDRELPTATAPTGPVTIGGVEQIKPDDPRLTVLWKRIQDATVGKGAQYDQMATAMGGPKRKKRKQYRFTLPVQMTVDVDMVIIATSAKEARAKFAEAYGASTIEAAIKSKAGQRLDKIIDSMEPGLGLASAILTSFNQARQTRARTTILGVPDGAKATLTDSSVYE